MLEMERIYVKPVYKFSAKTKKALHKLGFKICKRENGSDSEVASATVAGVDLKIYTPTKDGDRMCFQSINHSFVDNDGNTNDALDYLINSAKALIDLAEKLKEI